MARGWESKAIEDQIAEADARAAAAQQPELSDSARSRQARRTALEMTRTRVLRDLQTACNANHRATLETSLAFIDDQLQAIDRDE